MCMMIMLEISKNGRKKIIFYRILLYLVNYNIFKCVFNQSDISPYIKFDSIIITFEQVE